ncbi:MAG: tetratricopeptide repeat protein [Polyangiaceae bacterium]
MANQDVGRISLRPLGSYVNPSVQPETLPFESDPPSVGIAGEDFLYHLSRGSELLKENQVGPAKEALELALSLQPQDVRGQGLLGVTYFRLGLYPRAIDIYQKLVFACPDAIPPKINLALCYVKTGQHHAARELLEQVVQLEPTHQRAWGYLGLTFQFLHDFAKAHVAFERAGQTGMAERMLRFAEQSEPVANESIPVERWELRAAAEDAFSAIDDGTRSFVAAPSSSGSDTDARSGRWRALEPGEEAIPEPERVPRRISTPPPSVRPPPLSSWGGVDGYPELPDAVAEPKRVHLREWLHARAPSLLGGTAARVDHRTLLVELDEPFAVRADAVILAAPAAVPRREIRVLVRSRGAETEEPLGSAATPIVGFMGPGRIVARTDEQRILELFELEDESVTLRQSALFGLSSVSNTMPNGCSLPAASRWRSFALPDVGS